ncbi:MAG: PSD1 and planctomycete cytochrome C domain-containing protein [Planctomycetaceae bacterium]
MFVRRLLAILLLCCSTISVAENDPNGPAQQPAEVAAPLTKGKAKDSETASDAASVDPVVTAEQREFFEKQVRPLLVEHCHQCHSAKQQKGELRLDSRAAMLRGGDTGPAIIPGKPDASELYLAVSYDPNGYQMPPKGKLPDAAIEVFKRWVEMGAPWPQTAGDGQGAEGHGVVETNWPSVRDERAKHWSFQPLLRPSRPKELPEWAKSWSRNPIDEFLAMKLDAVGLRPAAEADRRTWLRRLSFDVIGLPPTPEEMATYLADESPEADSRQVDRLLASPHYGERWGRHWLDLVRYAESRGHEFDYDVANPWHYRDYVIRALNADVPYDQFVVEHVAGDLLPSAKSSGEHEADASGPFRTRLNPETGGNESILATGFWFFGEWVHSPVDIRQEEAERFDNMIDVYSKTFLGLTVACARCHDHKFDPISAADFYAMQGYLQSTSYRQVPFESMEQNRRVGEELVVARQQVQAELLRAYSQTVETTINDIDKYLLATREALSLGVKYRSELDDIRFADFESGTYAGWTTTGDAFGDKPQTQKTIANYQGDVGAVGRFFVNSHQVRMKGKGDGHVGTLTSDSFKIERQYISMLVGGGAHQGKTCVNLLVDGKVVRTQTGANDNRMSRATWDVRDLMGKTATIQVVDEELGGWGNIGVDEIVFTQSEAGQSWESPENLDPAFRRKLVAVARNHAVNLRVLEQWVVWAASDAGKKDPIFGAWWRGENNAIRLKPAALTPLGELAEFDGELIADYRSGQAKLLTQPIFDGPIFATGLRRRGDLRFDEEVTVEVTNEDAVQQSIPFQGVVTESAIERDRFWDGLKSAPGTMSEAGRTANWDRGGRMLRTPTFTITKPKLFALVKGGVRTYAAVDSHITINGPLHGSLLREHAARNDWHWIEHDVARYIGHGAHWEFVPQGDDDFAVAIVVQGTAAPQMQDIAGEDAPPTGADEQRVAHWYRNRFDQVLHALYGEGGISLASPGNAEIANWMMQHPALVGVGPEARERLQSATKGFVTKLQELKSRRVLVSATAPAMLDGNAQEEYVFIRGNWKKVGEIAHRRFLEVFPPQKVAAFDPSNKQTRLPSPSATQVVLTNDDSPVVVKGSADGEMATLSASESGSGRLALAMQMVDPQQTPILARVIVNRVWLHEFGRGLVPSPDDFGHLGQPASHPELLDWLACELIDHKWSLKHIHRLILNSSAYRMSSQMPTDDVELSHIAKVDPMNVLLHRMNVKRLEGEIIRDAILAGSGRLDPTVGGPSVPLHLTAFLEGRGRPGASGPIDGNGRRSLYISVRRNFPEPFLQAFDFPNPHSTTGRRSVSNVPAQALALMNNPFVLEQTRVWAERLLRETPQGATEQRLESLYQEALGRNPSGREVTLAKAFLESQAQELSQTIDSSALWADMIHTVINSKEFAFIP